MAYRSKPAARKYSLSRWNWALAVVLGAIVLGIQARGADVWYDDAVHWLTGRSLLHTGRMAFPARPHAPDPYAIYMTAGPAVQYPAAGWMALAGDGIWVARWLFVAAGILFLAMFWHTARCLTDARRAFWACLMVVGSLQWSTYSAQYLGEGPMLLYLWMGIFAFWKGLATAGPRQWLFWIGAAACWNLAILSKEYIALPIGLALAGFCGYALLRNRKLLAPTLAMGFLLPVGAALHYAVRFPDFDTFWTYWQAKSAISIEFWAWQFTHSLRFLATKPVVVLGYVALSAKVLFRRTAPEVFLWLLQTVLLACFVVSLGYDRFGMLLLPVSAVYLAEWVVFGMGQLAKPWVKFRHAKLLAFICLVIILSWQRSLWVVPQRLFAQPNAAERAAAQFLNAQVPVGSRIYLADLALLPFVPRHQPHIFLPSAPPAGAIGCDTLPAVSFDAFVLGVYSFTEFPPACALPPRGYRLGFATPAPRPNRYEVWLRQVVNK